MNYPENLKKGDTIGICDVHHQEESLKKMQSKN